MEVDIEQVIDVSSIYYNYSTDNVYHKDHKVHWHG